MSWFSLWFVMVNFLTAFLSFSPGHTSDENYYQHPASEGIHQQEIEENFYTSNEELSRSGVKLSLSNKQMKRVKKSSKVYGRHKSQEVYTFTSPFHGACYSLPFQIFSRKKSASIREY